MKQNFTLFLLLSIFSLVGCEPTDGGKETTNCPNELTVSNLSLNIDSYSKTRLSFANNESSVGISWQKEDSFTVYNSTGELIGEYNFTASIGDNSSIFSPAENFEPNFTEGDSYFAIFPSIEGVSTLEEHRAALGENISNQTQSGSASYSGLNSALGMESKFAATATKNSVDFNISNPTINIAFKASNNTPPSKLVFTDVGSNEYTLNFVDLEKTNLYNAYIVVDPSDAKESRKLNVKIFSQDNIIFDSTWTSDIQYRAGVQYNLDFTQTKDANCIYSESDLVAFRNEVNKGNNTSCNAVLMNDIDLTISNWEPIGSNSKPYKGVFDGNGFKINGLNITGSEKYRGLFGSISGATIKDVTLVEGSVKSSNFAAILCGYASENSLILNCATEQGSLITESGSAVGGIVGSLMSGSVVENCSNSADISGVFDVGGVAGFVDCAPVNRSYNTGEVSGNAQVGGIVGQLYSNSDNLVACYNQGNIYGKVASTSIGGIAGLAWSTNISGCYNVGAVTGECLVGAIAGEIYEGSVLTSCYTVSGYNFGEGATLLSSIDELNGVVDDMNSSAGGDYFTQNSGNTLPSLMDENLEYKTKPFSYNFTISSVEDLEMLREVASKENAILDVSLQSNIELSGEWIPIYTFYGSFEGNGHSISNISISIQGAKYLGLFGNIIHADISNLRIINPDITGHSFIGALAGSIDGGTVTNCSVEGGYITGLNNQIGGMFGSNGGTVVTNCFNSSVVEGSAAVGGLSGRSCLGSDIITSYNIGDVYGNSRVGGLIGHCSGDTKGCYNTGNITANNKVAGLIGFIYDEPVIAGNYSVGTVTGEKEFGGIISIDYPVDNCYYLSDQAIGDYGIMLSTLEELNNVVENMNEAAGGDYFTVNGNGILPSLLDEQIEY